jgi:hypothetical protein
MTDDVLEIEVLDGQILLNGRAVATLIPGLPYVVECDLVEALTRNVQQEIDDARADSRDEAFRAVAGKDPAALEEVAAWRSIMEAQA